MQENDIVTLNQRYKRGNGWQTHFCLSFVEPIFRKSINTQNSVRATSITLTQLEVLLASMLLWSLHLWQETASSPKYTAWFYALNLAYFEIKLQFCVEQFQTYPFLSHNTTEKGYSQDSPESFSRSSSLRILSLINPLNYFTLLKQMLANRNMITNGLLIQLPW